VRSRPAEGSVFSFEIETPATLDPVRTWLREGPKEQRGHS
jgi:hypothetical protein